MDKANEEGGGRGVSQNPLSLRLEWKHWPNVFGRKKWAVYLVDYRGWTHGAGHSMVSQQDALKALRHSVKCTDEWISTEENRRLSLQYLDLIKEGRGA